MNYALPQIRFFFGIIFLYYDIGNNSPVIDKEPEQKSFKTLDVAQVITIESCGSPQIDKARPSPDETLNRVAD